MNKIQPILKLSSLAGLLLVTACGGGGPAKNTYHSHNGGTTTPAAGVGGVKEQGTEKNSNKLGEQVNKQSNAQAPVKRSFMCTFSKKSATASDVSEQKENIEFSNGESVAAKAYLEQTDGKFEVEVKDGYLQIAYVAAAEKSKPVQARLALAKGNSLDLSVKSVSVELLASCAEPVVADFSRSLNTSKLDPALSQTFQCAGNDTDGETKAESKTVSLKVLAETPEAKPIDALVSTEISGSSKQKMSVDADHYAGEISLVIASSENGTVVKATTSSSASSIELKSDANVMQCKVDVK